MTPFARYLVEHKETLRSFALRSGCDKSTLSRVCNGKEPSLANAQKIVAATDGLVTFEDLMPRKRRSA